MMTNLVIPEAVRLYIKKELGHDPEVRLFQLDSFIPVVYCGHTDGTVEIVKMIKADHKGYKGYIGVCPICDMAFYYYEGMSQEH